MKPYDKREFDKATTIADKNTEQFRYEATVTYAAYTRADRKALRKVQPIELFYARYREWFQPVIKELGRKKPFDTIKSDLVKGLMVGDTEADSLTEKLYRERHNSLIREAATLLPHRSRRHVVRILHLPSERLDALLDKYHQAELYRDVAVSRHIAVYDPNSLFISRTIAKWRIRRNRKKTLHSEQMRITMIDRQLQKIDNDRGDLLQRIVSNDLQAVPLVALRNELAKKIADSNRHDSLRQLDQFEKITKTFVNQRINAYLVQSPDSQLKVLAAKKRVIEQILHDVFSLSNAERNQLILDFSDYFRLYTEREAIHSSQRERNEYISRTV